MSTKLHLKQKLILDPGPMKAVQTFHTSSEERSRAFAAYDDAGPAAHLYMTDGRGNIREYESDGVFLPVIEPGALPWKVEAEIAW